MKLQTDHDLHCHSRLSACSGVPEMTAETIFAHAAHAGYKTVCITDHMWERAVPGASPWYAPQDEEHVSRLLPVGNIPEGVRFVFGCETEFCGGEKLGISKAGYGAFGFVAIPVNHFHMEGFVRPKGCDSERDRGELFLSRLEELFALDLPWEKTGLAHLNCGFTYDGHTPELFSRLDRGRLADIFTLCAEKGAGVELNAASFPPGWRAFEDGHLAVFRAARDRGCKFYCASDAHSPKGLPIVCERLPEVIDLLELTEADKYTIPG